MKRTTFAQSKKSDRFITLSEGNKKLIPSKDAKFLIWNLPAIVTCPFATEHCRSLCYALKAERVYPSVKKSRYEHFELSKSNDFVNRMIFTINAYMNRPSYKNAKKVIVRIHESGDFYNLKYTLAWLDIALAFLNNKKIVFMAYTKSVDYFKGLTLPDNMVVRFSLWDDTKLKDAMIAKIMGLPIYTAVDKFTNETAKEKCPCKDCGKCGKCWEKSIDMIKCEIH